jgi:two-component system cell cycle response regulator
MDKGNSVIIVYNDGVPADILKEGLASQGYRCEVTPSALAALQHIDETPFDIMIADIAIPDLDCFELIKKAKKLRPAMAVIVLSRSLDESSYEKAIEKGASDFMEKPVTPEGLLVRIRHAMLHERLREMSVKDELTGLYNRRGFYTLAEHQFRMASRLKRGIFLLFADFDRLKALNDRFGHREGDLALIKTAEILRETFRDSDIIARIGGDEFVVFPIGTADDDVERTVARFQENLATGNTPRTGKGMLSLSVGLAYYDPADPCSVDELLVRADRSMYERKKMR